MRKMTIYIVNGFQYIAVWVGRRKGGWDEGIFGYFFSIFCVKCPLASQGLALLVEQQATVFSLLRIKSGLEIRLAISQQTRVGIQEIGTR